MTRWILDVGRVDGDGGPGSRVGRAVGVGDQSGVVVDRQHPHEPSVSWYVWYEIVSASSVTSTIGGPEGVVVVVSFVTAVEGGVAGDEPLEPVSGVVEDPGPLDWPEAVICAMFACCWASRTSTPAAGLCSG